MELATVATFIFSGFPAPCVPFAVLKISCTLHSSIKYVNSLAKDCLNRVVKSECVGGEQNIHYLAPKYCLMAEDAVVSKTEKCSTQIPFYLQVS